MTGYLQHIKRLTAVILVTVVTQQASAHPLLSIFPKGDKPSGPVFTLLTVAAIFTALAVHELGHLLTGLAQGFRFELFVVGPLGIKRTNTGSVSIYLNKNLGYMGGIAATTPKTPSPNNRAKFAWLVAAGPLASLAFGLLMCLLFKYSHGGAARSYMLTAGAASLGLALATTIPTKSGIFFTDRARFQRLMSPGKAGDVEEALLNVMAQINVDQSAKNISLTDVHLIQTDGEPFMQFWGYYYEHQYFKDNGLEAETAAALASMINKKGTIPESIWKALKIEEPAA